MRSHSYVAIILLAAAIISDAAQATPTYPGWDYAWTPGWQVGSGWISDNSQGKTNNGGIFPNNAPSTDGSSVDGITLLPNLGTSANDAAGGDNAGTQGDNGGFPGFTEDTGVGGGDDPAGDLGSISTSIIGESAFVPTEINGSGSESDDNSGPIVSEVAAAVPEPGTLALLGSGLAGMFFGRFRRHPRRANNLSWGMFHADPAGWMTGDARSARAP